jgi:hypothetical protein
MRREDQVTPLEKARELAVRMHDDPHNGDYCWRLAVDTFIDELDRLITEGRTEPEKPAFCPSCGGTWIDDDNGTCDNEFHAWENGPRP